MGADFDLDEFNCFDRFNYHLSEKADNNDNNEKYKMVTTRLERKSEVEMGVVECYGRVRVELFVDGIIHNCWEKYWSTSDGGEDQAIYELESYARKITLELVEKNQ